MIQPLHARLADDLRRAITSGELLPGAGLPSEAELQRTHDVSRITVRKALATLEQEGLITATAGRGRTVRSATVWDWHLLDYERLHRKHGKTDGWASDVLEQGGDPHEQVVAVEVVEPPEDVRDRLDLGDQSALLRRRIRSISGRPAQLSASYFPYELVKNTDFMQPGPQSAPSGLLASIGYPQTVKRHEITARNAGPDEARDLQLPPGTPLIRHVVVGYADTRPVRCMITLAASDVARIVIEEDQ